MEGLAGQTVKRGSAIVIVACHELTEVAMS
jgi:hypothetical protein